MEEVIGSSPATMQLSMMIQAIDIKQVANDSPVSDMTSPFCYTAPHAHSVEEVNRGCTTHTSSWREICFRPKSYTGI
jgi:hypothetical protein